MSGITLFVFGGVAEMKEEPHSPKAEFFMAIAGPLSSVVLVAAFWALAQWGQARGWPPQVYGVLGYLGWINAILVVFNLVPAFPLDGGRVARSVIWSWNKNFRAATRIVTAIGSGFGLLLTGLGILGFVLGNFIGGIWWFMIGLFLRNAAQMSYQRRLDARGVNGEPVRRFMTADLVTVSPSTSVQELVNDYIYRYHHKLYPVVSDGDLLGCVTLSQVKQIPKQEWAISRVSELVKQCDNGNTIDASADAIDALSRMSKEQVSRLMVVKDDKLVGMVSLKDLLKFLSLKMELETAGGK